MPLARALLCTVALAGGLATTTPAAPQAEAPAKTAEGIHFGRSAIRGQTVVVGSIAVRNVVLKNSTAQAARLTEVKLDGDAVALTLLRELQPFPTALNSPFAMELPAGAGVTFQVRFDAKDLPLGDRMSKLTAIVDDRPHELAIAWEVVEPPKDDGDDLPIPKPKSDWEKYATQGPPPRLECDRWSHDFGRKMSGERLKTEFKLKNSGEGDLVIIKVGAQCHCTLSALRLPDRVVPPKELKAKEAYGTLKPGEEATLECDVDTAGMAGTTRKKIQIYTSDRARSPVSIDLTMVIDNPFQFSPSSINFGGVRSGEAIERVVRMSSVDQGEFEIVGHELPQPQVVDIEYVKVTPRRNEQCAWEIKLRTRAGIECKDHVGRIKLLLDHERIAVLDQLHYTMRGLPDVEWTLDHKPTPKSPEMITLGVVKPKVNDVRTIVLENKNPKVPWKLTGAKVTSRIGSDPFAVECVTLEEGQRYEVKFSVIAPPKTKSFAGEIEISADSATAPKLKLKFSGIWAGNVPPTDPATGGR
ncbi:MAG: DUF1573 domain-containing protein [Planctomycetes bacterium]|nr:DUF1573 domain-containing protein [Planctomycetota bacterium]